MVSPITVIDETSNDDDEIILNLNLEMTIHDYDMDGRKNDALTEAAAAAAAKAVAEIAAVKAAAKAAAEIAAATAAAEIATAKAAAAKAAAELVAVKAAAEIAAATAAAEDANDFSYKRNIHLAGRLYPSVAPEVSITVRDGKVILAKSDNSDPHQQWYRFQRHHIKDVKGWPSITFINNGTGLTLQHAIRINSPVRLIKFNEDDRSVLWTVGGITGSGAFPIRYVDDIGLQLVPTHYKDGSLIEMREFKHPNWAADEHLYWKFTEWK